MKNMGSLCVIEKFVSINGEGNRAGSLSVFIRFRGCNLFCSYCDTKWANDPNTTFENLTVEEIYHYIKQTNITNVTLTGGEPLIQNNIGNLLEILLSDVKLDIEIETNGSIDIFPFLKYKKRPCFTIDYKLENQLEQQMNTNNYNYLTLKDSVKFVCGSIDDLERAEMIVRKYNLLSKCQVFFCPIYNKLDLAVIVDYMKEKILNGIRVQTQLHKIIWGEEMRGV